MINTPDLPRWMRSATLHLAWMLAAACAFSALIHRAGRQGMDAPFSFLTLALAAFVFLGALMLMLRVARASRFGRVVRGLAVLALALVASWSAVAGAVMVSGFYWPSGQDVDGDFVVKKWSRPDMMDPGDITIQALYFRGREVTAQLDRYRRHPTQPAVVLFVRFESYNLPVTYAFDGGTFRTLRLTSGDAMPFLDPSPVRDQWSPDKMKLLLYRMDELYVFDVARWHVSRLTGNPGPPGQGSGPAFAGWSPGSRRLALIDYGRPSSPNPQRVVLSEWDAETATARLVGCMPRPPHHVYWSSGTDFKWQDDSLVVTEEARRYIVPCPDRG